MSEIREPKWLQDLDAKVKAIETPPPWEEYRCSYCDEDSSCGINGATWDVSHDECHHTVHRKDMALIADAPVDLAVCIEEIRRLRRALASVMEQDESTCECECESENDCSGSQLCASIARKALGIPENRPELPANEVSKDG